MTEVGIVEYFSMAEALGIIATLFVTLFLKKANAGLVRRHKNKNSQ